MSVVGGSGSKTIPSSFFRSLRRLYYRKRINKSILFSNEHIRDLFENFVLQKVDSYTIDFYRWDDMVYMQMCMLLYFIQKRNFFRFCALETWRIKEVNRIINTTPTHVRNTLTYRYIFISKLFIFTVEWFRSRTTYAYAHYVLILAEVSISREQKISMWMNSHIEFIYSRSLECNVKHIVSNKLT